MASIQALHAPSPRRAASCAASQSAASPIVIANDPTYTFARCRSPCSPPSRLLSPIRLMDRRARPSCSASVSPLCSSTNPKRRRPHIRGPIRHRHCKLPDCPVVRDGLSVFDQLPWIPMVDQSPTVDPWDIADLSQLTFERSNRPAKTTGPIRSRKSSLRSAPFPSDIMPGVVSPPELSSLLPSDSPLLELPFARARRLSFGDDRPSTPPPRTPVCLSEVDFRNLMPVTLRNVDNCFSS